MFLNLWGNYPNKNEKLGPHYQIYEFLESKILSFSLRLENVYELKELNIEVNIRSGGLNIFFRRDIITNFSSRSNLFFFYVLGYL